MAWLASALGANEPLTKPANDAPREVSARWQRLTAFSVPLLPTTHVRAAETEVIGFPKHPQWKFVFVNHVTTNPFFVPLRYGAGDACALLGCTYQWTGSEKVIATEMVDAFNTAVSGKADGIAISLVDPSAFNDPVEKALAAGIPVVSYNADAKGGNKRLCYIGQDLFQSGKALGQRIVDAVGEGQVAGFIATPGQLNRWFVGTGRNQYGVDVRHERERRSLPEHSKPLRGKFERSKGAYTIRAYIVRIMPADKVDSLPQRQEPIRRLERHRLAHQVGLFCFARERQASRSQPCF